MLDPHIVDELIARHTVHALRDMLLYIEPRTETQAYFIAAIYYLEGTDND